MLYKIISSKSIAFFIALVFGFFFVQKITKTIAEKECLVAYDSYGYYMYLPHLFEKGSLNISKEWAEKRQYEYCDKSIPVYQLIPADNGNLVNIYHMGLALIELPSYTIAHTFAKLFNYKADGFSTPYRVAFYLNALFFIFIGIIFLRRLLLNFFTDRITMLVLVSIFFASNIFATYLFMYQLQHLYLFALNTAMLYFLFKFLKEFKKKQIVISAIIFGITCFIRPTQALWGIIPLILLVKEFGWTIKFWKHLLYFPLFAIIFNIPHVLYWKIIAGVFFKVNMHTEELILVDPNISDFLFSFQKGWFIYSPIFLLIFPAFFYLYKNKRNLFWALLVFTGLSIWVLSAWECWWYAASFGSRVMVDGYAVMAILLGFGFVQLFKSKVTKIIAIFFVMLCLPLNLLQSYQYYFGYLDYERMTSQHYWYIFGKTSIKNYSGELLEINRGDLNWPQQVKAGGNKRLKIINTNLFSINDFEIAPNQSSIIKRIRLLDQLPNDETLIQAEIVYQSSDSTNNASFRLEMESKYNTYSWNTLELALGKQKNTSLKQELNFNLAPIRHRKDELIVYVDNKTAFPIKVESIKIKGSTLIRK